MGVTAGDTTRDSAPQQIPTLSSKEKDGGEAPDGEEKARARRAAKAGEAKVRAKAKAKDLEKGKAARDSSSSM